MKTGYIVKARLESGIVILNHLASNELHLISRITKDSQNGEVQVKRTTYANIDEFILQRF